MFNEDRPEFSGFNKFYGQEIEPYLTAHESVRQDQVSKGKLRGGAVAIIGLLIAAYCYVRFGLNAAAIQPKIFSILIPSCAGIGIGFAVLHSHLSDLKGQVKNHLMGNICAFLNWQYSEKGFEPPLLDIYQQNDLLSGRIDRTAFEDQMRGHAHGADFTFCEAKLERKDKDSKGRTQWHTVFRGILLEIDFHRDFAGRTVVLRDAGLFKAKKRKGMKRVGLADPVFEKIFEAYGTDQVEARYLLTPTFMQRLVDLEQSVDGKNARFGFLDGKLYIVVDAPNQFEAGSMFQSFGDGARTQKILDEVGAIYNVIDGVMKPLDKAYF